jgi:hypothetical protein
MSLTGVADAVPPTLVSRHSVDPFASRSFVASEPLPPGVTASLRSAGGETIDLIAEGTAGTCVTAFHKPPQALRYGTQYSVVTSGVADFAGNAAPERTIMTGEPPPLAAEDGFEGVSDTTFGGVTVLSGTDAPTITGAKSLYMRPGSGVPLTLRLRLSGGDSAVRFSYRVVTSDVASYAIPFTLGIEGGAIGAPMVPMDPGTATSPATLDGTAVSLGAIGTATLPLPAGATGEVVLTRWWEPAGDTCTSLPPWAAGIIIDDLRAE